MNRFLSGFAHLLSTCGISNVGWYFRVPAFFWGIVYHWACQMPNFGELLDLLASSAWTEAVELDGPCFWSDYQEIQQSFLFLHF